MTQQICTSKGVAATHLQHVKVAAVAHSHSQKSLEHSIAVETVMSEEREVARCRRQQADADQSNQPVNRPRNIRPETRNFDRSIEIPTCLGQIWSTHNFDRCDNIIIRSCMRARRFSDCMHVRSTAVSEIRTLDMHARARFQRSNSVMHVFTVMHDQLCMMRALFNTSFTRILLALLLATSQTICTVAIEIVRRSKLRVSGLTW